MASKETFAEILARKKPVQATSPDKNAEDVALPVKGGRQTSPEGINTLGRFISEMAIIEPDFNAQLLGALEQLAIVNGEIGYAVDNIVQLGNTLGSFPENIYFDDAVSDEMAKEMIARLKVRSKKWYAYSGGMNSLANDLFAQIAINGALSAEKVPNLALDGLEKIVTVAPKTIRFKYDDILGHYVPFQIVGGKATLDLSGVRLNPITYTYMAYRRVTEKPYGVPPFITALENIGISQMINSNLKYIVKKLGVLGFLEVLVNGPKPAQGESDSAYYTRTEKYLASVIPEVEKGVSKGYVVGFKGMHEFKMQPTTAGSTGAKEITDMNDAKLFAGLKQDPMMFGRNFSTTETLARVILAKTTTQIVNYQKLVGGFFEECFLLDLQLGGYPVKTVSIEVPAPMIGDKDKEETTFGKKIDNQDKLYKQGIISQQQRAQALGYDEPAEEEPRAEVLAIDPNIANDTKKTADGKDPAKVEDPKKDTSNKNKLLSWQKRSVEDIVSLSGLKIVDVELHSGEVIENVFVANGQYITDIDSRDVVKITPSAPVKLVDLSKYYETTLGSESREYEYSSEGCNCDRHTESFASGTPLSPFEKLINKYLRATKDKYDLATKKTARQIAQTLSALPLSATETEAIDATFLSLYKNWGDNFTKPQKAVVNKFVKDIYSFYRSDKSIFDKKDGVPEATFNTLDFRSIEFYKKSDTLYMGKFITDEDTKKKITEFIKRNHLNGDLPIGNNKELMSAFKKELGGVLEGEEWKLRRIISTTVNKMRNTAAVNYMNDAEVSEFEIAGVNDRLQCGYCAALQGKKFSISKAMDNIMSMTKKSPSELDETSPFITSVYKKPSDMAGVSSEELQKNGIGMPPFHANCRDTIVAIL